MQGGQVGGQCQGSAANWDDHLDSRVSECWDFIQEVTATTCNWCQSSSAQLLQSLRGRTGHSDSEPHLGSSLSSSVLAACCHSDLDPGQQRDGVLTVRSEQEPEPSLGFHLSEFKCHQKPRSRHKMASTCVNLSTTLLSSDLCGRSGPFTWSAVTTDMT